MSMCENISLKVKNCIYAAFSGIFFFGGWWIMIDLDAVYPDLMYLKAVYHLPIIIETLSFIIVNIVPYGSSLDPFAFESKVCNPGMWVIYLFLGLMLSFCSLIGASYVLVNDFLLKLRRCLWPGYAVFLQTFFVFIANMLMKFGIKQEMF